MKKLKNLLDQRRFFVKPEIDEKTILYMCAQIIKQEYGQRGSVKIKIMRYQEKIIWLKIENSVWAQEILLNKKSLIDKINRKIGKKVVREIKLSQSSLASF